MPLYAKPDSIIVYGDFKRNFTYDYTENAKAVIYCLEDGMTAETTVYDSEAKKVLTIKAVRNGGKITVTTDGKAENITFESAQKLDIVRA